ncbi:MAG: DrmE family protein [Thermoplasmatales archaeon]
MALCLTKDGKSCAIYSPFYESGYLPYPMIISAKNMLFGRETSSYLVIGAKQEWQTVLKNVYRHGDVGNHPLLKYYDYRDILSLRTAVSRTTKRKSGKNIRWIFSGFFNNDLWDQLEDVALIIVDLTSGTPPKLDRPDVETIMSYSSKKTIPAVFFLRNPLDKVAKYLHEFGVYMIYPPVKTITKDSLETPQIHSHHTYDQELDAFLTEYNLRSYKINKNGFKKAVEIRRIDEDGQFRNLYRKFCELKSSLLTNDSGDYGRKVWYRCRNLFDATMEFTGAVNVDLTSRFQWMTHPIGEAKDAFFNVIWNLSDISRDLASELIDMVGSLMREFETRPTPKGEYLIEILRYCKTDKKTPIILGKKEALKGFLKNVLSEYSSDAERFIVSPDHLENTYSSDLLIMLNPLYGRERMKLLTSCASKLIILNYPWQESITLKSIDEVQKLVDMESTPFENIVKTEQELNNTPENIIKVNITVNENKLDMLERKDTIELKRLAEINSLELTDFNDFSDDDPDEEEDDDFSFLSAFIGNDGSYDIQKWIVPIEKRDVLIPENKKIVLVTENKTFLTTPSRLMPGDRILMTRDLSPRSLSDFVWEILERKFGINRKIHPGNEWREKLKEYVRKNPGITYPEILENLTLQGKIGIRTPTAIYFWLESDDVIGPQDRETLEAIAKLVGSPEKVKVWQSGIQYIRSRHRKLIRHMWQVFKYNATELKEMYNEDYIVDPELGITISEIAKLVRFASITGTPRKLENNS